MRYNLWISIISPVFIAVMFIFNSVAEEKTNSNDIENNRKQIEQVVEKQEEQSEDIQKNKEATIEIKGEIKNINDKLDSVKEMIKDIKSSLDKRDNK